MRGDWRRRGKKKGRDCGDVMRSLGEEGVSGGKG
jgi:hypothetical protein